MTAVYMTPRYLPNTPGEWVALCVIVLALFVSGVLLVGAREP